MWQPAEERCKRARPRCGQHNEVTLRSKVSHRPTVRQLTLEEAVIFVSTMRMSSWPGKRFEIPSPFTYRGGYRVLFLLALQAASQSCFAQSQHRRWAIVINHAELTASQNSRKSFQDVHSAINAALRVSAKDAIAGQRAIQETTRATMLTVRIAISTTRTRSGRASDVVCVFLRWPCRRSGAALASNCSREHGRGAGGWHSSVIVVVFECAISADSTLQEIYPTATCRSACLSRASIVRCRLPYIMSLVSHPTSRRASC